MARNFMELLRARWAAGKRLCVGLDSEFDKIPVCEHVCGETDTDVRATMFNFNVEIVRATAEFACAFKPNFMFYFAQGPKGCEALIDTISYIHNRAPEIPVILDIKFADIGNTTAQFIRGLADYYKPDAVTVNPYLGAEALKDLLAIPELGIFVVCRTSNKGGGEFQDALMRPDHPFRDTLSLYQSVAAQVAHGWNANGNCGLVTGATYPAELGAVRRIVGKMPLLIPGIGKQGGDLEASIAAGMDDDGEGMIFNSSSGLIFAGRGENYPEGVRAAALELHDQISRACDAHLAARQNKG
jgi:orotidine-5'-phosphate decarboxylase